MVAVKDDLLALLRQRMAKRYAHDGEPLRYAGELTAPKAPTGTSAAPKATPAPKAPKPAAIPKPPPLPKPAPPPAGLPHPKALAGSSVGGQFQPKPKLQLPQGHPLNEHQQHLTNAPMLPQGAAPVRTLLHAGDRPLTGQEHQHMADTHARVAAMHRTAGDVAKASSHEGVAEWHQSQGAAKRWREGLPANPKTQKAVYPESQPFKQPPWDQYKPFPQPQQYPVGQGVQPPPAAQPDQPQPADWQWKDLALPVTAPWETAKLLKRTIDQAKVQIGNAQGWGGKAQALASVLKHVPARWEQHVKRLFDDPAKLQEAETYLDRVVQTGPDRTQTDPAAQNTQQKGILSAQDEGAAPAASQQKIQNAGNLAQTGSNRTQTGPDRTGQQMPPQGHVWQPTAQTLQNLQKAAQSGDQAFLDRFRQEAAQYHGVDAEQHIQKAMGSSASPNAQAAEKYPMKRAETVFQDLLDYNVGGAYSISVNPDFAPLKRLFDQGKIKSASDVHKFLNAAPVKPQATAQSQEQQHTTADSYGTLLHYHADFGIANIPSQAEFSGLLANSPVVQITPEQAVDFQNTSVSPHLIGKGVSDPSVISGMGMGDQRHDSWQSVLHHAGKQQDAPVVAVKHGGQVWLLDGDHRMMASVLMNRPVMAKIIDLDSAAVSSAQPQAQQQTLEPDQPQLPTTPAQPLTFRTAQGSTYTYENGQTQRTKSPHVGHEIADVGVKERSELTHFVNPEDAQKIGMWNSVQGLPGPKKLVVHGNHAYLLNWNTQTNQYHTSGKVELQDKPAQGLSPLELWKGAEDKDFPGAKVYGNNHPGNAIVSIDDGGQRPVTTAPADETPQAPMAQVEPTAQKPLQNLPRSKPLPGSPPAAHYGTQAKVVMDSGRAVDAHYAVYPMEDLIGSVSMGTVGSIDNVARGIYPEGLQPRGGYTQGGKELEKVYRQAAALGDEPARALYYISHHPGADNGGSVITPDGIVLSGNGRLATLQRAKQIPGAYDNYRDTLMQHAASFGLDPQAVQGMKDPVLVRVVDMGSHSPEAFELAREGNNPSVQMQGAAETSRALSDIITMDLMGQLRLDADTTFSKAVSDPSAGKAFRQTLAMALRQKAPTMLPLILNDAGGLTPYGVDFVRRMLLSKVIPNGIIDSLDTNQKRMLHGVESAIPLLINAQRLGRQANFTPQVVEALGVLSRHPEIKTAQQLDNLFGQGNFDGTRDEPISLGGRMLAEFIVANPHAVGMRKGLAALTDALSTMEEGSGLFAGSASEAASDALGVQHQPGAVFGNTKTGPHIQHQLVKEQHGYEDDVRQAHEAGFAEGRIPEDIQRDIAGVAEAGRADADARVAALQAQKPEDLSLYVPPGGELTPFERGMLNGKNAITKQFGNAKEEGVTGTTAEYNGRKVTLSYLPHSNTYHVGFGFTNEKRKELGLRTRFQLANRPGEMDPGSMDFVRRLFKAIKDIGQSGAGISYGADKAHREFYRKAMPRLGFTLKSSENWGGRYDFDTWVPVKSDVSLYVPPGASQAEPFTEAELGELAQALPDTPQVEQPAGQPILAPRAKITPSAGFASAHAERVHKHLTGFLDKAPLDDMQKKWYAHSLKKVANGLTQRAAARILVNVKGVNFHKTTLAMTEALAQAHPEHTQLQALVKAGRHCGGAFDSKTGILDLDGDSTMEDAFGERAQRYAGFNTSGAYAHELTHAIDGRNEHSKSPEWQAAWAAEIASQDPALESRLSDYAETNAMEGFAEFGRLLYSRDIPPETIEYHFPKSVAYWNKHGLWEGDGGEEPAPAGESTGETSLYVPPLKVSSTGWFTNHKHAVQSLLGNMDDKALASLVGTDSGSVKVTPTRWNGERPGISLSVKHPEYECRRVLYREENGDLVCHNSDFRVYDKQKGLGTQIFTKQVESLINAGCKRIEATAGGRPDDPNWNGFITWPKLGYDGPIPEATLAKLPTELQGCKTVLDIMDREGGADWWEKNGQPFHATFSLEPGSRSLERLNNYLAHRGKPKVESK
jgi:hypothetical protein